MVLHSGFGVILKELFHWVFEGGQLLMDKLYDMNTLHL
jgi:hypothetical protein